MGFCGRGNVWIENSDANAELFVGFIQLFFDKSAKTFKLTVLVAYLVHEILLNLSAREKY